MNISSIFLILALALQITLGAEQTLLIIKPDAVEKNHIGEIIAILEKERLKVINIKMVHLTKEQAGLFYAVHKDRPFYSALVNFMSSGPIVPIALEGENAVAKTRELIGNTNPQNAANGTIRARFGTSKGYNAVHASDSLENAEIELSFFFS